MRILFVCDDNTFSSLIAEHIVNKYYSPESEAKSCGIRIDGKITDSMKYILAKTGIDTIDLKRNHINAFCEEDWDSVVCFSKQAMSYVKMTVHPNPIFILVDVPKGDSEDKYLRARGKIIDGIEYLFDEGAI